MGALPSTCITYSRYEEPATGRELKLSLMAWLHQGLPKQKAETQQLRGCSAGALWACVFCVCMPLCVPCGSQDSCTAEFRSSWLCGFLEATLVSNLSTSSKEGFHWPETQ